MDPRSALEYARASKVRIYTVAVGRGGMVSFPVKKDGKSSMVKANVPVETGDLIEIARESGGDYFLITEADEVKAVSSKILSAFQAVVARYQT